MPTTFIIRLSSLGDVAIAVPVLYSVAESYPNHFFLLITQSGQSMLVNKPFNLSVFPVDTKGEHKGIKGILRLLLDLSPFVRKHELKVADLHGVIRSFFLDFHFWFRGYWVAIIDKDRRGKQRLVRKKNKIRLPLKTSLERYREVFEKLGYYPLITFTGFFPEKPVKEHILIGIAPFSKHKGKMYPLELMEKVVSLLSESPNVQITLWGSKEECSRIESWTKKYRNVAFIPGQMSLYDEFPLMNQLDLMLSMDSANMHLASLVNTPVISIWGATHPYAGFYGFNQDPSNAIQIDMPCRPCSIFGNKPCYRGDYACLTQITPEMITEKIKAYLMI